MKDDKDFWESLKVLSQKVNEALDEEKKISDDWWNSLTYEDQCKAFIAVVSRIYKAEVKDMGTFRYALYDVFDFGPDMYGVAMGVGYMEIHNLISKAMDEKIAALTKELELG